MFVRCPFFDYRVSIINGVDVNDVRNVRSVAALYLRERQLEHNTWPIPVYVLRSTYTLNLLLYSTPFMSPWFDTLILALNPSLNRTCGGVI